MSRRIGTEERCIDCGARLDAPPAPSSWRERSLGALPLPGVAMVASSGVAAVVVVHWFWPLHWIMRTFGTLCHESGHALTAILCGRAAIPSFDLVNGGGVTPVTERYTSLFIIMLALVIGAAWRLRAIRALSIPLAALACLQLVLVATGWDMPALIEMGPGAQALAALIFLARAFSGDAVAHQAERWLCGLVGWCLLFDAMGLCWSLTHDQDAVAHYLEGKGSIDNDFVRLADDYFNTSLQAVAWWNFAACLLTPVAAAGWCWYRRLFAGAA